MQHSVILGEIESGEQRIPPKGLFQSGTQKYWFSSTKQSYGMR